jgi:hypothetical protein
MAAYEDFEYFRTGESKARTATATPVPGERTRGERNVLRDELERLHDEVTELREKAHRFDWPHRLARWVRRVSGIELGSRRSPALPR